MLYNAIGKITKRAKNRQLHEKPYKPLKMAGFRLMYQECGRKNAAFADESGTLYLVVWTARTNKDCIHGRKKNCSKSVIRALFCAASGILRSMKCKGGFAHVCNNAGRHPAGGVGGGRTVLFPAAAPVTAERAGARAGEQPRNGADAPPAVDSPVRAAGGKGAPDENERRDWSGGRHSQPEGDSLRRESAACADLRPARHRQDLCGAAGAGGGEAVAGDTFPRGCAVHRGGCDVRAL